MEARNESVLCDNDSVSGGWRACNAQELIQVHSGFTAQAGTLFKRRTPGIVGPLTGARFGPRKCGKVTATCNITGTFCMKVTIY